MKLQKIYYCSDDKKFESSRISRFNSNTIYFIFNMENINDFSRFNANPTNIDNKKQILV